MLILGLRFPGRTPPGEHPKRQSVPVDLGGEPKNASRMPPDQRSDVGTTVSTTRKSSEMSGDVQPLGDGLTSVERRPRMRYGSLSPNRRRRCGNVGIARLGFWRDFQARGEAWKSPGASFSLQLTVGRTFPRFPRRVISTATFPPPLPRAFKGSAARDGGGSGCWVRGQAENFFSQEVNS
jgi:hypothetical protein